MAGVPYRARQLRRPRILLAMDAGNGKGDAEESLFWMINP